jgi:hypothetical protein
MKFERQFFVVESVNLVTAVTVTMTDIFLFFLPHDLLLYSGIRVWVLL